ncbi:MAG TPA: hypothetical protein DIW66_06150 [Serratia liquefaciens]|nr:hypothetical protein [Serratia liquefaciens]
MLAALKYAVGLEILSAAPICKMYIYPIAFKSQSGAQLAHPQALTRVSHWGERQICREQI